MIHGDSIDRKVFERLRDNFLGGLSVMSAEEDQVWDNELKIFI